MSSLRATLANEKLHSFIFSCNKFNISAAGILWQCQQVEKTGFAARTHKNEIIKQHIHWTSYDTKIWKDKLWYSSLDKLSSKIGINKQK